jgi:hypothetical protein
MALEASHIRFALDVKDKYQVKNINKYVSGAIYPDSRYVTKIERHLTHPDDFLTWDILKLDDFKKGLHTHLLYDKSQWKVTMEKFPEIFTLGDASHGNERWIKHTALKILQDLDDVKKFNILEFLPCLDYTENLNDEDMNKLKEYNNIFQKMYSNPKEVNIDSSYKMWGEFGIGDELANKVKAAAEDYNNNPDAMKLIYQIYPDSLVKAESLLNNI